MTTSNSTNETGNITHEYASLRDQLAGFGFYYLTDILVTAIYIPTCFIGSFLSLICVVVFYQRDFKLPMYAYLRLYSIANTMLALVSIYSALTTPIQLFPFFNSQASSIYVSYVYEPIMSMCYFFTTVLDIAMLMDRIAIFVPKLKPIFCKHPYIVSAVIFVICLCIDFPFFFFYMPNSTLFHLNDTEYYRLYYVDYTSFGYSNAGRVVQYCQWALRDILPVVLIFICGVVSVALLKAHMRKKQRIIGPARKTAKSDGDTHSKNESASHTGHAAGGGGGHANDPDAHSLNNSTNGHQSHHHRHQSSEKHAGSRSNMRFSLLVYSISFLTTIQSIFSILALASILLDPGSILVTITNNVFNCFLVFKICCYFFIFYFLNSNFKKKINSWVMLKSSTK